MRATLTLVTFCVLQPLAARGQTTVVEPADRTALAVTVYSGFAQVRDTRRVDPPAPVVVWTGFPETIDPGTLILDADGRSLDLEAAVRPLLGQGRAALFAPGDSVTLVDQDGARVPAVVVSPDGPVYRTGDRLIVDWRGHVEAVAPESPLPALRLRVDAAPPGAWTASYLAEGFGWAADYVAVLEEEGPMRLDGGVTIENRTGFATPEATLQLVAGDVRRGGGIGPPVPFARNQAMEVAATSDVERVAFADIHLYTLPGRTTIGAGEAVQVSLFRGASVAVERSYVLHGQPWWYQSLHPEQPPLEHPEITLRFQNEDLAGGDEPLPAGTMHTYQRGPGGALLFTGDAPIPHTPSDERVVATIGTAFDLVAERRQTDYRSIDERTHESGWRITLRNRGTEDRTVTLYESFPGEWTVLEESRPHERIDARTARWTVAVPAGGETDLTFRVRVTV